MVNSASMFICYVNSFCRECYLEFYSKFKPHAFTTRCLPLIDTLFIFADVFVWV